MLQINVKKSILIINHLQLVETLLFFLSKLQGFFIIFYTSFFHIVQMFFTSFFHIVLTLNPPLFLIKKSILIINHLQLVETLLFFLNKLQGFFIIFYTMYYIKNPP